MQKKKISFSLFLLAMELYCLKMWSLIYQHSVDNTIAIKAIRNIRNPLAFSNLSTFLLDRFKSAPWLFFSDSPFIWTKLRHYLSQYRLIKWAWLFHSCFSMHRVTTSFGDLVDFEHYFIIISQFSYNFPYYSFVFSPSEFVKVLFYQHFGVQYSMCTGWSIWRAHCFQRWCSSECEHFTAETVFGSKITAICANFTDSFWKSNTQATGAIQMGQKVC